MTNEQLQQWLVATGVVKDAAPDWDFLLKRKSLQYPLPAHQQVQLAALTFMASRALAIYGGAYPLQAREVNG